MKFTWKKDKADKCCWTLDVNGKYFGLICGNGKGAYGWGIPYFISGSISQRKKQFQKLAEDVEGGIEKYRNKLRQER